MELKKTKPSLISYKVPGSKKIQKECYWNVIWARCGNFSHVEISPRWQHGAFFRGGLQTTGTKQHIRYCTMERGVGFRSTTGPTWRLLNINTGSWNNKGKGEVPVLDALPYPNKHHHHSCKTRQKKIIPEMFYTTFITENELDSSWKWDRCAESQQMYRRLTRRGE